ncbi:hypothetical protein [Spirillospora sp. CA-128828]|uniref:hypothetical protein n=1 Tax=Spirillospora sp. CA-128828 TaxID=3240033 RepID=UPI003D90EDDC
MRKRFRRIENHVVAVAKLQAEADALLEDAHQEAERLREQAAKVEEAGKQDAKRKRTEIGPHLAALVNLGQTVADVAEWCEVSRAEVRAAKSTAAAEMETDSQPRPVDAAGSPSAAEVSGFAGEGPDVGGSGTVKTTTATPAGAGPGTEPGTGLEPGAETKLNADRRAGDAPGALGGSEVPGPARRSAGVGLEG